MANAERWLSVEEIAEHLGISKETVYRWLERSHIPAHKVGKQWRFLASEINEWVLKGKAAEEHNSRTEGELANE